MSTSDRENDSHSRNGTAKSIGPFQIQKRAQTFDTGAAPGKILWGIAEKKVRKKINTYRYQNFAHDKDIRILRIFPGKKSSRLECVLFTSALPSAEHLSLRSESAIHSYWALSYWWGEGEATNPITIYDDIEERERLQKMTPFNPSKIFYVRDNLAAALRQFRDETEAINVWVDALCINQGEEPDAVREKTVQVKRMAEIYSAADSVCVWLGAGKDGTKATFQFLKDILNLEYLDRLQNCPETSEKWMLVVNLMKNRWFSRRWVIQELAFAKSATVRWGSEEMTWPNFADSIALFMTKHEQMKETRSRAKSFSKISDPNVHVGALDPRALGANTLVHATSSLFRRSDDGKIQQRLVSLEVLVSSLFLAFEASEPKDIIYAVLSLAKDTTIRHELADPPSWVIPPTPTLSMQIQDWILWLCIVLLKLFNWSQNESLRIAPAKKPQPSLGIDKRILPDYDKSLADVYSDFMEYCIESSKSLDILCRHWAPRPKKMTPLEKLRMEKSEWKEEAVKMPSWIPFIDGHAYGGPGGVLNGRKNGDSFVGNLERQNQQHYCASGGLSPYVKFGKWEQIKQPEQSGFRNEYQGTRKSGPVSLDSVPEAPNQTPTVLLPLPPKFDGTLEVKGFKLDSIKKLSGRVLNGVIPAEAFEYGGWVHSDDGTFPAEVPDRLWRTLVADRGPDGVNAPTWYRRACLECLMHVDANGDLDTGGFGDLDDTPATMKIFLERVRSVIWCRKFFLSQGKGKGGSHGPLFGLAPPEAREGDCICILFGCSVPVVLRAVTPDRHSFVGECYVHGMMDGEALPLTFPKHPYRSVIGFTII
ncbi:hypothetical protein ACEPPN_014208 [Leptodophora sp. 'Broadleaf-Isolate-01']